MDITHLQRSQQLVSCLVDSLAVAFDGVEDLVGGLGPDVGAGVLVPGVDPWRMSALRARTERCAPRLSSLVVSSANQRSTRLIQLLEVGVKCSTNRGCCASQRWICGVLWLEALSSTRCTSRSAGTFAVDRLQELRELDRAVALVQGADDLPGLDVQRGVEARGAVALVVVGRALGRAGQHRQRRRGAVQRLDLRLLIDAQHHRPLGRVQIQAADVVDLLDELRVLGELPASPGGGVAARTRARSASPSPA